VRVRLTHRSLRVAGRPARHCGVAPRLHGIDSPRFQGCQPRKGNAVAVTEFPPDSRPDRAPTGNVAAVPVFPVLRSLGEKVRFSHHPRSRPPNGLTVLAAAAVTLSGTMLGLGPATAAVDEPIRYRLTEGSPPQAAVALPAWLNDRPCPRFRHASSYIELIRRVKTIYVNDLLSRKCFYYTTYLMNFFGGRQIMSLQENQILSSTLVNDFPSQFQTGRSAPRGGVSIYMYLAERLGDGSMTPAAAVVVGVGPNRTITAARLEEVFGLPITIKDYVIRHAPPGFTSGPPTPGAPRDGSPAERPQSTPARGTPAGRAGAGIPLGDKELGYAFDTKGVAYVLDVTLGADATLNGIILSRGR